MGYDYSATLIFGWKVDEDEVRKHFKEDLDEIDFEDGKNVPAGCKIVCTSFFDQYTYYVSLCGGNHCNYLWLDQLDQVRSDTARVERARRFAVHLGANDEAPDLIAVVEVCT